MKRILSLVLALLMCCILFGCDGSSPAQSDASVEIDLSPYAKQAYTLTMSREREFTPELGETAAYAAEYTCSDPNHISLHLLVLRFDVLNYINVNDSISTPGSYYVVYDMDTDKIYDTEMLCTQLYGGLPNLTERDEVLMQVLNRVDIAEKVGNIYHEKETLRVLGDAELEAINAKLGELKSASVEQGKQLLFDTVERFIANPPEGYTASGTLFHGVEYRNPDVKGTSVHCYLMDIRGEFRSKSDYSTRVVVAMDAKTGEIYSSLQPEYRKMNISNPSNIILYLLRNYDSVGINTSDIYFSDGETIVPLYGEIEALAPAMTQEALAAKVAEITGAWLADSGDIITESVYVKKAAQVRSKAFFGYTVDTVFVELEGTFRDSMKSDKIEPATSYIIGCDLKNGEIYTEDESNAFMDIATEQVNDMRELTLKGISGYESYVKREGDSVYSAAEERIELDQKGIFTANKGFDHQIPMNKGLL